MSITVTNAGDSLHYVDTTNDIDVYFNKDSFQTRRKGSEIWLNDETYKEQFDFSEVNTTEADASDWLTFLNSLLVVGGSDTALASELFGTTSPASVDANDLSVEYMVIAVRQVSPGSPIMIDSGLLASTNDNYIIRARLNPTIVDSGSLVWSALGPYCEAAQAVAGNPTTNTVTGGQLLAVGVADFQQGTSMLTPNAGLSMSDVYVITAEPLSTNLDVRGTINTKQP